MADTATKAPNPVVFFDIALAGEYTSSRELCLLARVELLRPEDAAVGSVVYILLCLVRFAQNHAPFGPYGPLLQNISLLSIPII